MDFLGVQLTLQGQKGPNTQEFLHQGEEGCKAPTPQTPVVLPLPDQQPLLRRHQARSLQERCTATSRGTVKSLVLDADSREGLGNPCSALHLAVTTAT